MAAVLRGGCAQVTHTSRGSHCCCGCQQLLSPCSSLALYCHLDWSLLGAHRGCCAVGRLRPGSPCHWGRSPAALHRQVSERRLPCPHLASRPTSGAMRHPAHVLKAQENVLAAEVRTSGAPCLILSNAPPGLSGADCAASDLGLHGPRCVHLLSTPLAGRLETQQ